MHRRDIDWERLDRYVAGEGTPAECEELRRWAESDPELRAIAEVMRTAQRLPGAELLRWDARQSWAVVAERLGLPSDWSAESPSSAPAARPVRRSARRPVLQLASIGHARRRRVGLALAAAGLVAVVGADRWFGWQLMQRLPAFAADRTPALEYTTLRGQRLIVYLSDRTQVTLAPESRLRLASNYGQGARVVDLRGQAYFVVAHDAARPFLVRTEHGLARDLGTRFVVRAYPETAISDVAVAEGRVEMVSSSAAGGSRHDGLVLEAGEVGRITAAGGPARISGVSPDDYLAWATGELRLQHAVLRDALIELGRWYDVDVRLADPSLGSEEVTASFRDEPASAAIGLIATAAGLVVEQRDTGFVLYRKRD